MSELLKTFDSYNDFGRKVYFTVLFDRLPSELLFETPLTVSKEKLDEVIALIQPIENKLDLVFKNWKTEDIKNADIEKDFPYQQLFKSSEKKLLLWVSLGYGSLTVEFQYDCQDSALEEWVLQINHKLRQQLGLSKSPAFKVLSKYSSGFETEEVRTEAIQVDIKRNYNDDFEPIHKKIVCAIENKGSGLILLHGQPGTGKTTYIKHLISTFGEQNFIFIQNEFVNNLLDPDFISFLLIQKNAILIVEDAEKVITSRELQQVESVVSTILQLTDGLFSDYLNIKIICTFNSDLSKIDNALLRKGRMIAKYEFMPLCKEKTNSILAGVGATEVDEALSLADIFNHSDKEFGNVSKGKIGF